MYLLIIGWVYVVLMMAVSEATSTQGTVLGAVVTFLLYGVLPLSIALYLMGTPGRRARRRAARARQEAGTVPAASAVDASGQAPDGRGHAAGDAVAPEGKEP